MISKVKVTDDNKLSYNVVLHHEKITEEYFKVVGNYKFKYVDKQIFSTYNSTTEKYNQIISGFNYLWGNKKCVVLNDDCIFYILTFLDAVNVVKCSMINKQFYAVSRSELLWKILFENMFWYKKYENNFYTYYKNFIEYDKRIAKDNVERSIKLYTPNINITYIQIGSKSISHIPPQIAKLNNLQTLDLCDNKIQTIPIEIFNMINLKTLDISCNKLKFIPAQIEKLINLKQLIVNNNKLTIIPPEVGNLKYLKEFSIFQNPIEIIPSELGKLKKLRILKLTKEQLENVPIEVKKLKNLQYIECYVYIGVNLCRKPVYIN